MTARDPAHLTALQQHRYMISLQVQVSMCACTHEVLLTSFPRYLGNQCLTADLCNYLLVSDTFLPTSLQWMEH